MAHRPPPDKSTSNDTRSRHSGPRAKLTGQPLYDDDTKELDAIDDTAARQPATADYPSVQSPKPAKPDPSDSATFGKGLRADIRTAVGSTANWSLPSPPVVHLAIAGVAMLLAPLIVPLGTRQESHVWQPIVARQGESVVLVDENTVGMRTVQEQLGKATITVHIGEPISGFPPGAADSVQLSLVLEPATNLSEPSRRLTADSAGLMQALCAEIDRKFSCDFGPIRADGTRRNQRTLWGAVVARALVFGGVGLLGVAGLLVAVRSRHSRRQAPFISAPSARRPS